MNLPDFSLAGWPFIERLGDAPEAITAALVSAVATIALVAFFSPRLPAGRARAAASRDGTNCDFLISGSSVKPLTEPARALVDSLSGPRLAALSGHFGSECPSLQQDLETLVLYGTAFAHHCPRGDGTAFEIVGEPRGGAAFLSIRPASEEARALREAQGQLARVSGEMRFLRDALDRAPLLAWSHGPDGQVVWANAVYRLRFDSQGAGLPDHRIPDGFTHVIEDVPLTPRGQGARRRVAVPSRDGAEPNWYEITQTVGAGGETLGFAQTTDDLVAAESSLRRFVETLTETFAHLPIGLAVFDKNRRLGLFNPALSDLVKIDAVWLAGRPSLRDFLERLRETRQMPEQKDFASWRRKLTELEEGARSGTYEENWQLPSGKIFRVTGRPHPQGALAFLFEDISTAIMLERKYRSELELSQATLDRVSEAVAVFDASGMLVFVNSAFEALWGLDPMERLDGPGVAAIAAVIAERCAPSAAWARLTEFTTAADARTSWTETIDLLDGRTVQMLVAPLPDASALVVFREETRVEGAEQTLGALPLEAVVNDLAIEALQAPVEALLPRLTAAVPAAPTSETFRMLGGAVQTLKQALGQAQALNALSQEGSSRAGGALSLLAAALAARGLSVDLPADSGTWDPELRRSAVALGLAAAEMSAAPGCIAISFETIQDVRRLTATAPSSADKTGGAEMRVDGAGLSRARRIVEASGGALRVVTGGQTLTLSMTLPRAGEETEAPAIRA